MGGARTEITRFNLVSPYEIESALFVPVEDSAHKLAIDDLPIADVSLERVDKVAAVAENV